MKVFHLNSHIIHTKKGTDRCPVDGFEIVLSLQGSLLVLESMQTCYDDDLVQDQQF